MRLSWPITIHGRKSRPWRTTLGDSFFLSQKAVELKEQTIVFCGVAFMGESAKILNPDKTVLMPEASADCPMAHMVDGETIDRARAEYADLAVVCYINSTAAYQGLLRRVRDLGQRGEDRKGPAQ